MLSLQDPSKVLELLRAECFQSVKLRSGKASIPKELSLSLHSTALLFAALADVTDVQFQAASKWRPPVMQVSLWAQGQKSGPSCTVRSGGGLWNDLVTFFYTIRIFIDLQWPLLTEVVIKIAQRECSAVKRQPET